MGILLNQPIVDVFILGILSESLGLKKDYASGICVRINGFKIVYHGEDEGGHPLVSLDEGWPPLQESHPLCEGMPAATPPFSVFFLSSLIFKFFWGRFVI